MSSILIVEDDATLRDLLYELFTDVYHCTAVASAEEALALLSSQRFEVVLTDISMAGMSGLELLGHIRQLWPDTTVIVASGIRDKEYAEGLLRMGAFDYLVKPFELLDVYDSITRALEQRPAAPEGGPEEAEGAAGAGEEPSEVFSSIQLDRVFSLSELLEMIQRDRMNGYLNLRWDESTVEAAERTGRFTDATGGFDGALRRCSGMIYLRDGLIIDATIVDAEDDPDWRDAEQSLALLVRLAVWVKVGVRAWGYVTADTSRPPRLAVSDNSGKLFSIITADEESSDEFEAEPPTGAAREDLSSAAFAFQGTGL